jgi:hypothetical protein
MSQGGGRGTAGGGHGGFGGGGQYGGGGSGGGGSGSGGGSGGYSGGGGAVTNAGATLSDGTTAAQNKADALAYAMSGGMKNDAGYGGLGAAANSGGSMVGTAGTGGANSDAGRGFGDRGGVFGTGISWDGSGTETSKALSSLGIKALSNFVPGFGTLLSAYSTISNLGKLTGAYSLPGLGLSVYGGGYTTPGSAGISYGNTGGLAGMGGNGYGGYGNYSGGSTNSNALSQAIPFAQAFQPLSGFNTSLTTGQGLPQGLGAIGINRLPGAGLGQLTNNQNYQLAPNYKVVGLGG